MAPSAAPLIKQRYTAGNCTLKLTLQPSALSKWYPQPIAEKVAFKLWMANAASEEPTLLAKGDRGALQALTNHIAHRTQATLTVGQTHRSAAASNTSDPTAIAQTIPPLPATIQLPEPLSQIQLSDLSSVLTQCEQAIKTLPVALNSSSIAAPKRKNNLIFFPKGRRIAWASSAAAALFAVGLTTTILNKDSQPENNSVANSELAVPQTTGGSNDRLRLGKPTEDELSAALPSNKRRNTNTQRGAGDTPIPSTSTPNTANQPGGAPPQNPSTSVASPNNPSAKSPSTSRSASSSAPPVSPSSPADSSPADSPVVEPAPLSEQPEAENSAPENESADLAEESVIAAAPTPSTRRSPDNALDRKITNAEPRAAESDTESLGPAAFSSQPAEADDLPALESAPSQTAARMPNDETEGAITSQESETLTQVQNYFLGQWNADNNLSAPLSYQLQLSSLGEIVSFSAITEGGNVYRDRLLPDNSITFPPSNSAALANGLTLKITVTPSGQVQVEKI